MARYTLEFTEDDGTPYTTVRANSKDQLIDELIFMLMNTANLYLTEDSDYS
jgi:hypothetical protein